MLVMLMLVLLEMVKIRSGVSDAYFSCGIEGVGTCWYSLMSVVL